MDVSIARHVLKTLFSDTKFPLIQHHLDSYDDMLDNGIRNFIRASNPFELELPDSRMVRVYVGGKDGSRLHYEPPVEENGTAVVPHTCRLENRTYALSLYADMEFEYTFTDKSTETKVFKDVQIGQIPLMLRSSKCYLSGIDGYTIGECKYELGGYFIIDGSEKVLLTQELLGDNMFYSGERMRKAPRTSMKSLIEKEEPIQLELTYEGKEKVKYEELVKETYTGIRTISEDGSKGPYSHFLTLPPPAMIQEANLEELKANVGRDNRLAMIQIPGFQNPVPVLSVFRALGVTSDRDLYDTVLAGVPDKDRLFYDDILTQIILSHEKFLDLNNLTDLEVLKSQARNKSRFEIAIAMYEMLFSHVEGDRDNIGALFRRKSYLLGEMLKMAIDVALDRRPPSDRDNMQFKRLKTSGVLMMEEFRRIYREIGKEMILRMDKKHTYRTSDFLDKNLVNLVEADRLKYFWRDWMMLQSFEKSFKGSWGGRVGIAQELARPSYAAVIHHLRKTDLQIDKSASTAPPRRYYGSQMGLMCPTDSPDGSDIGYKKSLTLFARVTTAFSSEQIKALLRRDSELFRDTSDIHPATWKPEWSKIYINSDLVGVSIGNTEELHKRLLQARRNGQLPIGVTLAWNRLNNEYKIYSDAGRPIRPVYRERTNPETIRTAPNWAVIQDNLDYIDASESDSIRLSLVPFSETMPSEIHMSFNLSALTNLVPYPDHNPGPRSVFSIAQQKQAASWYHTNYKKRFDTIAMMAACPQKPISQTWLYHEMMGPGGCLPYGENAIVAITVYGGHNQEDSVIVNGGSLRRGMYKTMYYHSYDVVEEMLDPTTKLQTVIGNPLTKDVKRLEGMNYEKLDANGIIKVDSIVDENTILVGMLSPVTSPTGQITAYRDVSTKPKRGQHGRVDAVYTFATQAGLRGVKIRIVEERTPVIGDKMASRHSQKGTVGQVLPEEDMPFTSLGQRPDIIFNPHGIPTRMTVGQFLEMSSNRLGVDLGSFVDATPFITQNRVQDMRNALLERGFEPYGSEVLYNGQTGEQMEVDIFMGPIYYQRLKHMVEDKINYRDTGPKKLLTRQPTQGRGDEGGLRIGEMERDSLISHGMMKFLNESLMERSDKADIMFDPEEGRFGTSRSSLSVPYSMALFSQELEAMHLKLKIETE